jgi:hypothetical protein
MSRRDLAYGELANRRKYDALQHVEPALLGHFRPILRGQALLSDSLERVR